MYFLILLLLQLHQNNLHVYRYYKKGVKYVTFKQTLSDVDKKNIYFTQPILCRWFLDLNEWAVK